jgi:hypothetical protein
MLCVHCNVDLGYVFIIMTWSIPLVVDLVSQGIIHVIRQSHGLLYTILSIIEVYIS